METHCLFIRESTRKGSWERLGYRMMCWVCGILVCLPLSGLSSKPKKTDIQCQVWIPSGNVPGYQRILLSGFVSFCQVLSGSVRSCQVLSGSVRLKCAGLCGILLCLPFSSNKKKQQIFGAVSMTCPVCSCMQCRTIVGFLCVVEPPRLGLAGGQNK